MKENNESPKGLLSGRPFWSAGSVWVGRLSRGKQYLCFCLLMWMAGSLNAQHSPAYRAYLKEKVRDPHIREYVEKLLEGTATQEDLRAFQAYYHDRHNNASRADEFIQEGAEPHIVIHPTDKNILALTFMQNSLTTADYPIFISRDGGASWVKSSFSTEAVLNSLFPGNLILGGGDPILAFDEDGTLYLSYIYVHGNFPTLRGDLFYVYSQDTGSTFIVPPLEDHVVYQGNIFASDMLDRQWMDIDNTGGPYNGNLYLSAFYFGGALNTAGQLVLTKPADSTKFQLDSVATAVAATSGNITQFGNVQVDQSGRVHLSCALIDEIDAGGLIYHTVSLDGGKTFAAPNQVGTGVLLAPQPGFTTSNSVIHDRENAAISMAVDGDHVYIAWTDLGNDASRAYFSYSHDAGANFSQQLEFGNLLLDSTTFHFMPNVAADSGHVTISWYSVDKSSGVTNYYMAESANGGVSFDSVRMVSDTSSLFVGGASAFYGDYNSSVKDGCTTWTVWSDGRTGAPDIYVAKTRFCDATGTQVTSIPELSPVSQDFSAGNIWPNPAADVVNIMLHHSKPQLVRTEVYDLEGRLVKSVEPVLLPEGTHEMKMDVAEFAPGQYVLKIISDTGLFAARMLYKQ